MQTYIDIRTLTIKYIYKYIYKIFSTMPCSLSIYRQRIGEFNLCKQTNKQSHIKRSTKGFQNRIALKLVVFVSCFLLAANLIYQKKLNRCMTTEGLCFMIGNCGAAKFYHYEVTAEQSFSDFIPLCGVSIFMWLTKKELNKLAHTIHETEVNVEKA